MPFADKFRRRVPLPKSRALRLGLGGLLVAGGILGFLPILGFWMIPVGLTVLSVDLPRARRIRRRADVAVTRRVRAAFGRLRRSARVVEPEVPRS